jgi:hypothetical protein
MEENPEKYPKRHGMPWDEDETQQLLIEIARKQTHEQIAETHGRTVNGILGCLKKIVQQYHDEGKSIQKIMKYTGLTMEMIEDTIEREKNRNERKEIIKKEKEEEKKNKKESKKQAPIVKTIETVPKERTIGNDDVCLRLERIENLLVKILDKLESL